MPPGQVKAARKMLQDLHVSIVTNAMVRRMHHAHQSSLLAYHFCTADLDQLCSCELQLS